MRGREDKGVRGNERQVGLGCALVRPRGRQPQEGASGATHDSLSESVLSLTPPAWQA